MRFYYSFHLFFHYWLEAEAKQELWNLFFHKIIGNLVDICGSITTNKKGEKKLLQFKILIIQGRGEKKKMKLPGLYLGSSQTLL